MKKILITGLVVIGVITIVVAANNVRINSSNPSFLVSLSDVESLTVESCLNHPALNTGHCSLNSGNLGVSCVKAQNQVSKDCYGVTTDHDH
jgi:hypothetical protein